MHTAEVTECSGVKVCQMPQDKKYIKKFNLFRVSNVDSQVVIIRKTVAERSRILGSSHARLNVLKR